MLNMKKKNFSNFPLGKRSQIQMGESIAILFIFFILMIFGFVFYMNIMKGSAKIDVEENIQLKAVGIAQKASFLPELQCSKDNVRVEDCIDKYKLGAVEKLLDDNNVYYYDLFEFSNISVRKIYPGTEENWNLYGNKPTEFRNRLSTFIPVSIFDPTDKSYGFGILTVEVYTK